MASGSLRYSVGVTAPGEYLRDEIEARALGTSPTFWLNLDSAYQNGVRGVS